MIPTSLSVPTQNETPRTSHDESSGKRMSTVKDLLGTWERRASASGGTPPSSSAWAVISSPARYQQSVPYTRSSRNNNYSRPDKTSNKQKRSTRQTMEDSAAFFASPRVVASKMRIHTNRAQADDPSFSVSTDQPSSTPTTPTNNESRALSHRQKQRTLSQVRRSLRKVEPPIINQKPRRNQQQEYTAANTPYMGAAVRRGSIAELAKQFEKSQTPLFPFPVESKTPTIVCGRRGSVLDQFTPRRDSLFADYDNGDDDEEYEGNKNRLPTINLDQTDLERDDDIFKVDPSESFRRILLLANIEDDEAKNENDIARPKMAEKKKTLNGPPTKAKPQQQQQEDSSHKISRTKKKRRSSKKGNKEGKSKSPSPKKKPKKKTKLSRDKMVYEEMKRMIARAEREEMEEIMEEEVKDVLKRAALRSHAYNKRYYDVINDSFVHCPSLATVVLDMTVIEKAEEIWGEELPLLYTASLRAVAAAMAEKEEKIPEYMYRLAS